MKTKQVNEMFDELNSLIAEKEAYAEQLKHLLIVDKSLCSLTLV